jgi:hypothetical protein
VRRTGEGQARRHRTAPWLCGLVVLAGLTACSSNSSSEGFCADVRGIDGLTRSPEAVKAKADLLQDLADGAPRAAADALDDLVLLAALPVESADEQRIASRLAELEAAVSVTCGTELALGAPARDDEGSDILEPASDGDLTPQPDESPATTQDSAPSPASSPAPSTTVPGTGSSSTTSTTAPGSSSSSSSSTSSTTTTRAGGGGRIDDYGDDPELDELYDDCGQGSGAACDELYLSSPDGSGYERYGATCGGYLDQPSGGDCAALFDDAFDYGDSDYFDELWDDCAGGDGIACDDLFLEAPVGSRYEEFGLTCGDRLPDGPAVACADETLT